MERNTREISEPEEAKQELKESKELYRIILEQSIVGIIIIQGGKVKYANDKLSKIYDLEPETFYNWQPGEFISVVHPDYREFVGEQVRKKILGLEDSVTNYNYKALKKSGEIIWLENYSKSIIFQGQPAILAIQIDITDKVQMEKQLKESEEKYRLLADNINDIIWTMDLDLKTTYVSPSVKSVVGNTVQEDMTLPLDKKFTPDSMIKVAKLIRDHIKPKNINNPNYNPTLTIEVDQYHKDGSIVPTEVRVNPMRDRNGIAIGLVGITRDISERKRTENKLKESEEKYRILFDQSPIGIGMGVYDAIFVTNQKMNELFGLTGEEFKKVNIGDLYGDKKYQREVVKELRETGRIRGFETGLKRKDGSIFHSRFNMDILKIDEENIYITTCEDITDRKIAELKLKKSEEKYREAYNLANFYKDLFAHDMNNILQSIVSSADYYKTFRDKPEMLAKLGDISDVVNQHAKRGASLISNVRKLSKLEESEVILKPIKLSQILNKSIEHSISGFQERNVNIQVNGLTEDLIINGDELTIDVFDNILNNAIKYNDNEQEVIVNIDISKVREDDKPCLKIEIKDHGMGIADKLKEKLFKKSRDTDISRRGMGMGLSLVKTIVDKYGGKIWVEDRVNGDYTKGSIFVIVLNEAIA